MWKAIVIVVLILGIGLGAWYAVDQLFLAPERQLKKEHEAFASKPMEAPPDPSLSDYSKLKPLREGNDLIAAREAYRDFLRNWPKSTVADEAKDTLGQINTDIFFSKYATPEKTEYTVKAGDALVKIASRLKTTPELIMRSNNLDGTLINIGDKLLISEPDFSMVVNQAEHSVSLYNHGEFFKRYKATTWDIPGKPQAPGREAKVTETIAWHSGERVAFGSKNYVGSVRWILTNVPSFTIYSDFAKAGDESKSDKPATGAGVPPEEMDELAALVRRGTPIVFE